MKKLNRSHEETLLTSAPHGLFSLLSFVNQNHLTRAVSVPKELGSPTSIIHQENILQTYLQANLREAFSQFRVPLPK